MRIYLEYSQRTHGWVTWAEMSYNRQSIRSRRQEGLAPRQIGEAGVKAWSELNKLRLFPVRDESAQVKPGGE